MELCEYKVMFETEDIYWWFLGLRQLTLQSISRYCPHGTMLLDAGCGTGGLLRYVYKHTTHLKGYGIDISPVSIEHAKSDGRFPIALASVEELPFQCGSIDIVTCLDVLYMEGVHDRQTLHEFYRVLKPGGTLIINLPAFEFMRSSHDQAVHTRHRYVRSEVVGMLKEKGFSVLKATYWNALLFPVICSIRLIRSMKTQDVIASDIRLLPDLLNSLFLQMLQIENRWVAHSSIPVGSSIFCVAQKIV